MGDRPNIPAHSLHAALSTRAVDASNIALLAAFSVIQLFFLYFGRVRTTISRHPHSSPQSMHFLRHRHSAKIRFAEPPSRIEPAYAIIAVLCVLAAVMTRNLVTPFHIIALLLAAIGNGILAFRPKL